MPTQSNSNSRPHRLAIKDRWISRPLRDAAFVAAVGVASWLLIERTEICTRFFRYVADHPEQELDSVILAGIFSTLGMLVFALRRWADAASAERSSDRLAYHDALTGLPNRRAFMRTLEQASNPNKSPLACLLFDLDNFKQVNDLRGHLVGDELLRNLSARLLKALPPDVVCARVGGDEFGLLCPRDGHRDPTGLAQVVVDLVSEPVLIAGQLVKTSASVGIAGVPDDTRYAEDVLRQADIALYRAKALGRGAIQRFEPAMEQADRRHAAISEALRDAIPKGEIIPHYQPIVALPAGDVVGFEVLARWEGCILGPVGPAEFIPIAIESGLIDELSCNVLEQACRSAAQWPTPLRISFNIAPVQICDPLLPTQLMAILSRSGLAPQRLEIELTEDALLSDDRAARANLDFLTIQGITLALDDFGTGYSSLHHLRSLPFDKVKIDRSFIGKIVGCDKALRMVAAIIAFTHSLGIEVLAEGVETKEHAALLKELGCDLAQGWLYGKPAANADLGPHQEHSPEVRSPKAMRA